MVKRESTRTLRGIIPVDSSRISRIFPAEFIEIFGGFIGDKRVEDFRGNPLRIFKINHGKSNEKSGGNEEILQYLSFFSDVFYY